jgi:hypothetical protein
VKKLLVAVVVSVLMLIAPTAIAAEDPTCNLPLRPHWCTP